MGVKKDGSLMDVFEKVMKLHFLRTYSLLENTGVYPGQLGLIFELYNSNGQSQRELCDALSVKASTITVMIKRLEKTGLIERKQDENDKRKCRIFITGEGRKICEDLKKINDQIEYECFEGFTIEEKVILRRLLIQVREI